MPIYEAYTNSDSTEGSGHDVTIAYFERREDALNALGVEE